MRLPRLFRTTPFRLTLLFLALFATVSSAFLAYVYVAAASEAARRTDQAIHHEMQVLSAVYLRAGPDALNEALIERAASERPFLYLLMAPDGARISGSIQESPIDDFAGRPTWAFFRITEQDAEGRTIRAPARGLQEQMPGGEILFVGADLAADEAYVLQIVRALWFAGALTILLGLAGGLLVSRNVSRSMSGLVDVVAAVRNGDLGARAQISEAHDEFDELAEGLNEMLERLERSMAGLRYAGDAIAHDLRSPLTRLRARLETASLDVDSGTVEPRQALARAIEETDGLLKTFGAVLAISRLQSAGQAPDRAPFDAAALARDMAELYEPLCEDKGVDFRLDVPDELTLRGDRGFIAQALANLLDNAVKYTPQGGAIRLRLTRGDTGEVAFAVADTGPGVPAADRARVVQRFVRLESSRNAPGAGLGLAMVAAVAEAHGGRLELGDGLGGPEAPGLAATLVLPGS